MRHPGYGAGPNAAGPPGQIGSSRNKRLKTCGTRWHSSGAATETHGIKQFIGGLAPGRARRRNVLSGQVITASIETAASAPTAGRVYHDEAGERRFAKQQEHAADVPYTFVRTSVNLQVERIA